MENTQREVLRFKYKNPELGQVVKAINEDLNTLQARVDGVTDGTESFDVINELTSGAGVTVDGVLLKDSQVTTDTINEKTSGSGVTADGVLLKDSRIKTNDGVVSSVAVKVGADGTGLYRVSSTQLGIAVGGVLIAVIDDNGLVADVINEKTSTVGVTVDGVLLKDGGVSGVGDMSKNGAATEGNGVLTLKSKSASKAFAGGGTEVIPVQVPAGALLVACQLRNDTILTATTGVNYDAAYSTGSTEAIATAVAFDKNVKSNKFFDAFAATAITTGATDVTLTPNAGTLDTGTVTAVVYYYELTAITDAV